MSPTQLDEQHNTRRKYLTAANVMATKEQQESNHAKHVCYRASNNKTDEAHTTEMKEVRKRPDTSPDQTAE